MFEGLMQKNPVIGSLIREIDIAKKDTLSKLLAKAPNPKDIEIKNRLDRLRNFRNYGSNNNNNNNNNENDLPPPSPPQVLLPPPHPFFPGRDSDGNNQFPAPSLTP